uniref:CUB domain-containing protein n=1 Tax=Panagrolaimus sp. JU765 TaxID=591449 RepID=A0AC34RD29_9BILA
MSMRLSSSFNETDPKCEWQAFQAFAYDTTQDFAGKFSDSVDNDNIFAVSTIKNDSESWSLLNDVDNLINVKIVLGHYFENKQDKIDIYLNTGIFSAYELYVPQLDYLIEESQRSAGGIKLSYNKDFGQNSWFYFFVSVATKKIDWNSNCEFQQLNANHWIFSLYDVTQGYPHNTYCKTVLNKTEGYQYKLWFEQYHVEPYFDNVAVDTPTYDDPITLKNSVYIVPYTEFAIQFDSDGSINQAGFILHIEKYGQFNSFINRIAL